MPIEYVYDTSKYNTNKCMETTKGQHKQCQNKPHDNGYCGRHQEKEIIMSSYRDPSTEYHTTEKVKVPRNQTKK